MLKYAAPIFLFIVAAAFIIAAVDYFEKEKRDNHLLIVSAGILFTAALLMFGVQYSEERIEFYRELDKAESEDEIVLLQRDLDAANQRIAESERLIAALEHLTAAQDSVIALLTDATDVDTDVKTNIGATVDADVKAENAGIAADTEAENASAAVDTSPKGTDADTYTGVDINPKD